MTRDTTGGDAAAREPTPGGGGEPARVEELFEAIAAPLRAQPGIETGTGFGSNAGLRVNGRIFAMTGHGGLIVKLPRARLWRPRKRSFPASPARST